MPLLKLSFFGPFEVTQGEQTVTSFESNKVRALLAYLAVEAERPHPRETLAGLLWPNWPEASARDNLRFALSDLRSAIGDRQAQPPYLLISRETLQFNSASDYWLDVRAFQDEIDKGQRLLSGEGEPTLAAGCFELALAKYRGVFLQGFSLEDCQAFEEWLLIKQQTFSRMTLKALRLITEYYEACGEYEKAIQLAWRQVESEPWQEEGYQQLMRNLALDGQRSAALAQYEACRQALSKDLGVEPSQETRDLFEQIRDGQIKPLALTQEPWMVVTPPTPGISPFKGLRYFEENDCELFFGREHLVARLVGHVQAMISPFRPGAYRFLAVVGASGSGKSSLVRAGLIPAMKQSPQVEGEQISSQAQQAWRICLLTPTAHPLEALAQAVTRLKERACEPADGKPANLLLVVDQFEELFALCSNETEREAFINLLLTASGVIESGQGNENLAEVAAGGQVVVVIALRADFYQHCAEYEPLRQALANRQEYIGPMNKAELRRAIEEPARRNAWDFEPGLVDLILRDAGDEPGALPLLSHALLETWRQRSGRTMTLNGYANAGGVHRAISQTADRVYRQFSLPEQAVARRIFLRLTQLGEGTQDTRRRVKIDELLPAAGDPQPVLDVLRVLSEARLVTLTEHNAEVAHEALIREWPALQEWLNEDREGMQLHHRLSEAAQVWAEIGNDPGALYRGSQLAQAIEWSEKSGRAETMNELEQAFLTASRELAEARAAELEAQRQRELEAAQSLAEAQRQRAEVEQQRAEVQARSAGQLRRRALFLVAALILALGFAAVAMYYARQSNLTAERNQALAVQNAANARLAQTQKALAQSASTQSYAEANTRATAEAYALQQRDLANQQATLSQARELALAAINNLQVDPERSILLAIQAVSSTTSAGLAVPAEVEDALHRALQASRVRLTLSGHSDQVWAVAFSPDGARLASASMDQSARIWDVATGQVLRVMSGHTNWVESIAYSPDGTRLATASLDGTARLWDPASGEAVLTLVDQEQPLVAIQYSPDGRYIAVSSSMGLVQVLEASSGKVLLTSQGPEQEWHSNLAFSPDSSVLACMCGEQTIRRWQLAANAAEVSISEMASFTLSAAGYPLAFHPDGNWLAAGLSDGGVMLLDSDNGAELVALTGHKALVRSLAFTPDGKYLASASQDGMVKVWAIGTSGENGGVTAEEVFTLAGHHNAVNAVAISPVCPSPPTANFNWCGPLLVSADRDGLVKVWDISPAGSSDWITVPGFTAFFSLDGSRFTTIGFKDANSIWTREWEATLASAARSMSERVLAGHQAPIVGGAYSADGRTLATLDAGMQVKIWNGEDGRELSGFPVTSHAGWVNVIALSPDGTRLATASDDTTAKVWDTASGEELLTLSGHSEAVWAVAFSPDGKLLATGSTDASVKVWDAATGAEQSTLMGHTWPINVVAFSQDGKRLASAGMDSTARVWDVRTGDELNVLSGHKASVVSVAFSPDGKRLASSSYDNTILLWDISSDAKSSQPVLILTGHTGVTHNLAFSPDSSVLAAGSYENETVRFYALDIAKLATLARARVSRQLTEEECQLYLHLDSCP